jgi:hypothetical protein
MRPATNPRWQGSELRRTGQGRELCTDARGERAYLELLCSELGIPGPHSAVWCGVVWCGVVWCGVVWCGVVWCGASHLDVRDEERVHPHCVLVAVKIVRLCSEILVILRHVGGPSSLASCLRGCYVLSPRTGEGGGGMWHVAWPGSFHCTVGNSPTHRLIQTTRRSGSVGVWA